VIRHYGWQKRSEDLRLTAIGGFDALEQRIAEFNAIDPGSYTFRYPVDTQGDPAVVENIAFDIQVVAAQLEPVLDFLASVGDALEYELDVYHEYLSNVASQGHDDYEPECCEPEGGDGDYGEHEHGEPVD
jgi:hypothetical protein